MRGGGGPDAPGTVAQDLDFTAATLKGSSSINSYTYQNVETGEATKQRGHPLA